MTGLQKLLAALALLAALVAACMIGAAGVGNKYGVWDYHFALDVLFHYAEMIAIGVAATAALVIVLALIRRKGGGVVTAVLAAIVAGGVYYVPWKLAQLEASLPPIHDITTDMEDPPVLLKLAEERTNRRCENGSDYNPANALLQRSAYPDVKPLISRDRADILFAKALALARQSGWLIAQSEAGEGRIEATAISEWFGFKDDVVIRITATGSTTRLDMRSVSCHRQSDIGANAERIQSFIEKLQ